MNDAIDNEDRRARTKDQVLATATRVLTIEGRALLALAGNLPADFAEAVERMLACRGRIISTSPSRPTRRGSPGPTTCCRNIRTR